jgi:uncharacterized protein YidB (DUF937 family)
MSGTTDTQGADLKELLERLVNPERGKGRLGAAAARSALGPSVATAYPTAAQPGAVGGLVSPVVEQAYAGSTFYSWVSSDGLTVLEFGDTTTWIDDDGAGVTFVIKHDDPATP